VRNPKKIKLQRELKNINRLASKSKTGELSLKVKLLNHLTTQIIRIITMEVMAKISNLSLIELFNYVVLS